MSSLNALAAFAARRFVAEPARDFRLSWAGVPSFSHSDTPYASSRDIPSSLVVVSNPVAGNGKAAAYVKGLRSSLERARRNGGAGAIGDMELISTDADRERRIVQIKASIERNGALEPPIVVAVGGDGTFADACEASLRARRHGIDSYVIPTPAGTACDMRRELGVPKDPAKLIDFIAMARRVELGAIVVRFGEGSERLLLHSLGCGVSGAVFDEVEAGRRRTGSASISSYLRGLVKGVLKTEPFLASVDGGEPLEVGELLVLDNSTVTGGVTRVPLPVLGARLHFIPVNARAPNLAGKIGQGVAALADVFGRGVWFMLGDKGVIAPGEEIAVLAGRYTLDIRQGAAHDVKLFGLDGRPKSVPAIMNGDTIGAISGFSIEDTGDTILTLAAADSDLMIRRGEATPTSSLVGARARFHRLVGGFMNARHDAEPADAAIEADVVPDEDAVTGADEAGEQTMFSNLQPVTVQAISVI